MFTLLISFTVAVADQITKFIVLWNFRAGETVPVIPGLFQLRYVKNTGAAWGIFSGFNNWLVFLSLIMVVILVVFRRSLYTESKWSRVAIGLLGGGIVGNLIDRIKLGYVVDFLDFYWQSSHFPAFNIADSAICVGVGIYMILQIRESRDGRDAPEEETETSDHAG